MNFVFTITQNLWKHDIFVIDVPAKYLVQSSVVCTAYASTNEIVWYNNTSGASNHALDCKETTKTNGANNVGDEPNYSTGQKLYIYGNANDIDFTSNRGTGQTTVHSGANNVKFEINGITNPWADFSSYNWEVRTMRFQTMTTIEESSTATT